MVVPLSCAGNWAREAANDMGDDGEVGGKEKFWLVRGGSLGWMLGILFSGIRRVRGWSCGG